MTVSVCMGIYNGENYIEEQLYSILHQTKAPAEVILCDDGSTDSTVEIVERFIRENQLENSWSLYRNQENRGYPANFYYVCSLCTKDIVFLADQDDIWHEKKIEKMCAVFASDSQIKSVCCKFGLIDAAGGDICSIMAPAKSKETGKLRQITIGDVFYKCEWPGMVIAYRNRWYQSLWGDGQSQISQVAFERISREIPHDFFISAKAAEENGFVQLDEELAYHRRHNSNTGKEEHRISKLLSKERKLGEIEDYLRILQGFATAHAMTTKQGQEALEEKRCSMQGRYDALRSGKIKDVVKNARKNKGQVRLATLVCDLVIIHCGKPFR